MIEQFLALKKLHPDAILFFRLGDFYEMFFEDARIASKELEIVLTARDGGGEKIPMCGIPYHALNNYLPKLIKKGFKVAICEQMEDPKQIKGIVKREVTRIVTAGTVVEDFILDDKKNNYLLSIVDEKNIYGFSFIDVSTGEFYICEFSGENALNLLLSEIDRLEPVECLLPAYSDIRDHLEEYSKKQNILINPIDDENLNLSKASDLILKHYQINSLESLGINNLNVGIKAASAIISFSQGNYKRSLHHIQRLKYYNPSEYMYLDHYTRRNLELTSTMRDNKREGTLLGVLDYCKTAIGKRTLKKWIEQPLMEVEDINYRLDAIEELKANLVLRAELRELLSSFYDIERLAAKIGSEVVSPRDLLSIKKSLLYIPDVKTLLVNCKTKYLQEINSIDQLRDLFELLEISIQDDAPLTIKEGNIFKALFNGEVDELRDISSQGSTWLLEFEKKEKERTGIKNLKVAYNRVFGYYIEISKSNLQLVPPDYVRKQTLVNVERYICEELKNREDKILGAREKLYDLEHTLFIDFRKNLLVYINRMQKTAKSIAELDVLLSLAEVAYQNNYNRPILKENNVLKIEGGRHPVVEKHLSESRFVPNELLMDSNEHQFAIITGPNMGGKSTFMRQIALISIMGQIGSFVPAEHAELCICDRIFTRVGASDDLAAGQSTFMVEMLELANILNNASKKSLIILDEIGRGTSTYDGLSIAQATCEYINENIAAKTLFATHYHEITELADKYDGIFNLSVSVMETGDTVVFLKKVLAGKADKSYGIHVGRLAGLPPTLIKRSEELLKTLENTPKSKDQELHLYQSSLFSQDNNELIKILQGLDPDKMTPRDALELIYRLKLLV